MVEEMWQEGDKKQEQAGAASRAIARSLWERTESG